MRFLILVFLLAAGGLEAQHRRTQRYALVLEGPPLAEVAGAKEAAEARLAAAQDALRGALESRGFRVLGANRLLVNAVYVAAPEDRVEELKALPGVRRVEPMRPIKRQLNKALELVNAQGAYNAIGGNSRAGLGVRIGILDTGIDHQHPAFQDDSLSVPAGFPKCRREECDYTNRKVIAARSYVGMLVLDDDPRDSRPDDLSPRDRVGHGTAAAMVAAGGSVRGPAATISGVAPKAFLGNYKIFGSPGVNDTSNDQALISALEDALTDGMDIASLSFGAPALWGPLDAGSVCRNSASEPCDLLAYAVENAVKAGLTVVTVAGNDGDLALKLPAMGTIHTPGTAPRAITAGASTNAQTFYAGVRVPGNGVPADLRRIPALFGNGPKPAPALTAPLRDVSKLEDDGKACSPLTRGSLNGAIALIERGDCGYFIKVLNAQKAGAVGAIIYQREGVNSIFPMQGLEDTGIPAAMIGNRNGVALKTWLSTNAEREATLDPALESAPADADFVAYFSSQGPSIGELAIKPEVAAPGTGMYMATQKYDPNGDMYDPSGYTTAQGTSFAAPLVAGAAALVKQRNPRLTPAQVKSAVVNTASDSLDDFDYNDKLVPARWVGGGAGKLNAADAVRTNLAVEPATVNFGVVNNAPLPSRTLRISNFSTGTLNLRFEVQASDRDANARVTVAPATLAVPAGGGADLRVALEGSVPAPGAYEGEIVISGGALPVRVPYLYLRGDGVPFNLIPLSGYDFTGIVNEDVPFGLTFKVVDRYGVPVAGAPVEWRATYGGGSIGRDAMQRTDSLGIAWAPAFLGPQLGEQEFSGGAGGMTLYFLGRGRQWALIESGGVVNAGSLRVGQGLAPGSYATIYGRGLSDATRLATTAPLPLSLAGVSVSFDVPGRRLSVPGRLHFVSDTQINVLIPWELQGLNSAVMKVSQGLFSSALVTVPLNDYSPAAFEYTEASSGRLLAAARDNNFALIGTGNPARRGQAIQIYANGMGPVDNAPSTGEPASGDPARLSRCRVEPEVTVGGRRAQVLFCGLTPGAVGLYQINLAVPEDAPTGIQPVTISVNGVAAKNTGLPVQ